MKPESLSVIDMPPVLAELADYARRVNRLFPHQPVTEKNIADFINEQEITLEYPLNYYIGCLRKRGIGVLK